MPDTPVITLQCAPGALTNGDIVSGRININLPLAHKEVEVVRVNLRGEIKTHVTTTTSRTDDTTSTVHRHAWQETVRLIDQTTVIWKPGALIHPPGASEMASFPFSFTLPLDSSLPPSFSGGNSAAGGSVQYYVQALAERKACHKSNVHINQAFSFLPLDHSVAPFLKLPEWPGKLHYYRASEKMRRGLFSHHGHVQVDLLMPKFTAIPLFRPIPTHLKIICSSKPLPTSAADDISKFEFPRNPQVTDCSVVLKESCDVRAHGLSSLLWDSYGSQGGFGTAGDHIRVTAGDPHWVVDENDKKKGCWREDITYFSYITFRSPPPFSVENLSTTAYLFVEVNFPGLGNKVKLEAGPLPLTSGKAPPGANPSPQNRGLASSTMPVANNSSQGELDLPPSYYEVMEMDEEKE